MIEIENLKPFPKFCYTIGMIPSSYKASLTYEEQLMWFCDFLENTVIPIVNNNGLAVTELQNLYIELKNYVDNYFENLDVQEEINNKLDEMVEQGTLQEIITSYLQIAGILAYNTVNDLKSAVNLTEGSFVKTYGNTTINDGKGNFYKVREITNDDIVDEEFIISLANENLIAELIPDNNFIVDVNQFGIKNDGSDMSTKLQNLMNIFTNGATFFFRNGTYYCKNINIPSNSKIIGEGNAKFIIPTNEEIACIFRTENKENITIENIKLQNGVNVNDGHNYGSVKSNVENLKSCIYFGSCENILIDNVYCDTFFDGIKFYNTNNVKILNSTLINSGYSGIMIFENSKHYIIENCSFENAYNNNGTGNTYMIAITDNDNETSIVVPEDIKINKCNFINNLGWEGIDTHGGNKISITNCYFENIHVAIALYNDQRYINRHLHMHDIIIDNNIFDGKNNENVQTSVINIFGSDEESTGEGFTCKNVTITNNQFMNNINNIERADIYLVYCENVEIQNNNFQGSKKILRLRNCVYGNIAHNTFEFNQDDFVMTFDGAQCFQFSKNVIINKNLIPQYIVYGMAISNVYFDQNFANYSNEFCRLQGNLFNFRTFGMPEIDHTNMLPIPRKISYFKKYTH